MLCSPVSQNRPRLPLDAKVKPPIMPNDRFASHKYQDPLATMPRICNPEAMSDDRGPAAEGVAHKIIFIDLTSDSPQLYQALQNTNAHAVPFPSAKTFISIGGWGVCPNREILMGPACVIPSLGLWTSISGPGCRAVPALGGVAV